MQFSSPNQIDKNNDNTHVHLPNSHYILIVDDESDILSVVRRLLEEYGLNTCCFTKPSIALEHYMTSSNNHDLVISDLQMPIINGFEFIRKVKESNPKVKVVLTSAFKINDKEFHNLLPDIKVDGFLQKPFSIQQLNNVVEKISVDSQ